MDDAQLFPVDDREKKPAPNPTDRQAEQMGLAGDLGELLAAARPRLLRLARMQGVAPDAIDDVVQETLVEAWRHLDNLRTPGRFHAWLDGICRNVCLRWSTNQKKHLQRQAALPDPFSEDPNGIDSSTENDFPDPLALDPAEEVSRQDLPHLLERALSYLSGGAREVVEMYYLAEIPQREIAQRLGLNIKALEVRLVRARRQLRQILNSQLRADAEALGLVLDQDHKALYNRRGARPGSQRASGLLIKEEGTYMNNINLFDRFTERAQKVVNLAGEEARHFQHNFVGSEHLLLGLVREGESAVARVLEAQGVTLEKVRKVVEEIKGHGKSEVQGEIGLTPHANKAIEMAIQGADYKHPRTEQSLLGTTYVQMGEAEQMLQDARIPPLWEVLGVTLEQVSKAVEAAKARGSTIVPIQIETGMAPFASKPEAAENWHHPLFFLDTRDLFFGLMRVADSTAVKILQGMGVSLKDLRSLVILEQITTFQTSNQGYFQRFTRQARNAWRLAQEEARRRQDSYIGGPHLLLGLVGEATGVAASVLAGMGVRPEKIRAEVDRTYDRGDKQDDVRLTPHLKDVFVQASNEARRLNNRSIGTGHLLLALVLGNDDQGLEAGLLKGQGVDLDEMRAAIRRALVENIASLSEQEADEIGEEDLYVPSASIASIEKDLRSRELDKVLLAVYPFSIEVQNVLATARNEAKNLAQRVGPEHLLIGLAFLTFRQKGLVGKVLNDLEIDFAKTQAAVVNRQVQGVQAGSVVLVQSALCNACLLLAVDEAGPGAPIKPEHLLLGLLREEKGIVADLLGELGTSVAAVRTRLHQGMSESGSV